MFENVDQSCIRVFVGVNHDVNLYFPDARYVRSLDRGDRYVLEDPTYKPVVFRRMQTLSLDTISMPSIAVGNLQFYMPKWKSPQQLPYNFADYDVIIVSDMYANDAMLRICGGTCTDGYYDFLDRLYKVGPKVFDSENKTRVIGTVGLEKVVTPNGGCSPNSCSNNVMWGYLNAFRATHKPSLSAVMQFMAACNQTPDIAYDPLYKELYYYVQDEITRRSQPPCPGVVLTWDI